MAYTNADWITVIDTAARETALRTHMSEIGSQITAEITSGGKARSVATLQTELTRLGIELDKLVGINARSTGSGITYTRKG